MAGLRTVSLLLGKDLLSEWRNRETFTVMLFFAVVILFLFHFSLNPERENSAQLAPGLLWLAFIFTGVLGLERSKPNERTNASNNCCSSPATGGIFMSANSWAISSSCWLLSC
jgi:heme exporter protein B